MWILFSILCMIFLTASEIVGKKAVGSDELASLKLRISVLATSTVIGIFMYAFGVGESGLAPWILMLKQPLIIVAALCLAFSDFLYLLCLQYVGMTIMEVISGFEGITIFTGILIINLITGNLSAVKDMFTPAHLFFILLILICTILLPNVESFANKNKFTKDKPKQGATLIFIGIMISMLAVIVGCGDSLITDTLIDSGAIGTIDIAMTGYFSQILLLPVFCFTLLKKSWKKKTSCKIISRYSVIYAILYVAYIFIGVLAISDDAVRTEVMFLVYPVISIIGAKVVLKEKYTWKQNLCIWIITISAILFCVIDYIV